MQERILRGDQRVPCTEESVSLQATAPGTEQPAPLTRRDCACCDESLFLIIVSVSCCNHRRRCVSALDEAVCSGSGQLRPLFRACVIETRPPCFSFVRPRRLVTTGKSMQDLRRA